MWMGHNPAQKASSLEPEPVPGSMVGLAMEAPMTSTPHLDQIERKYQSLKDQISEARHHPSIDDLELAELKRQKLLLKDELERLRHSEPQSSN